MSFLGASPIHTDLVVQDMNTSIRFYRDVLKYEVVEDAQIEGDIVRFLSNSATSKMRLTFLSRNKRSTMLELIQFEDNAINAVLESKKLSLNLSLSYLVENLETALKHFRDLGQMPVSPIFQISLPKLGNTQIVFFRDPDGHLIELVAAE
jgi:catechol 2,3-dioxygenase-like lactoylglutathione lyase family enzyme